MTAEPAPSREELEDQARRLLELARERSGATVEEMVKILGELQPRGAETRRSWYDWHGKPERISLLAGLAAMHRLGPEASMELVFGSRAPAESDRRGWETGRIEDLEAGLAETVAALARLNPAIERLGQVENLIGLLQAQMMEVRDTLGLPLSPKQADQPENAPSGRRAQHG